MKYSISFIQYCATLELKLTSLRKEILYILWCAKKPLKAYEILNELLKIKSNSTPPTVYRALIFFLASGVVHKIESIQSYTLCCEPEKHLPSEVLMVCNDCHHSRTILPNRSTDCHHVVEVYDSDMCSLISRIAKNNFFQLKQDVIELKGTCQQCL